MFIFPFDTNITHVFLSLYKKQNMIHLTRVCENV